MAWASSGGYPGVASDGSGGLSVTGAVLAGSLAVQPGGALIIYAPDGDALLNVDPNHNNAGVVLKHGVGLFGYLPPVAATSSAAGSPGATYGAPEQAFLVACLTALRSIGLVT